MHLRNGMADFVLTEADEEEDSRRGHLFVLSAQSRSCSRSLELGGFGAGQAARSLRKPLIGSRRVCIWLPVHDMLSPVRARDGNGCGGADT